MAGCLNKVTLIGHLGDAPKVSHTQDGRMIVSFSVATSESWKDKATGEKKEKTEWHKVVVFSDGLAKIAAQYLKKGSKAYICGQLQTRKWTDKDGVERYTTEIILNGFSAALILLDGRHSGEVQEGGYKPRSEDKPQATQGNDYLLDDDIPF